MVWRKKINDRCSLCQMVTRLCVCAAIPKIETRTRLTLLIHRRELSRTTNTGRLATQALTNSCLIVRGNEGEYLSESDVLPPNYQPILLYPAFGASTLTAEFLRNFKKPLNLIVPDGNWRQASKVGKREVMLRGVPKVKLPFTAISEYKLRRETNPEGLATIEAIARAFGLIESAEVQASLEEIFRLVVSRTLGSRPPTQLNKKSLRSEAKVPSLHEQGDTEKEKSHHVSESQP